MVILVFHDKWDRHHQLVGDQVFVESVLGRWAKCVRARDPSEESLFVGLQWCDLQWFEVFDRDMNEITHEFRNW